MKRKLFFLFIFCFTFYQFIPAAVPFSDTHSAQEVVGDKKIHDAQDVKITKEKLKNFAKKLIQKNEGAKASNPGVFNILSFSLAMLALVMLVLGGSFVFLSLLLALVGAGFGLTGLIRKEKLKGLGIAGLSLNGLLLLVFVLVFIFILALLQEGC